MTEQNKKTLNKRKAVGWGAVIAVLIPLLVSFISNIDGAGIGKRVSDELVKPSATIEASKETKSEQSLEKLQVRVEELGKGITSNKIEIEVVKTELQRLKEDLGSTVARITIENAENLKRLIEILQTMARIEGFLDGMKDQKGGDR